LRPLVEIRERRQEVGIVDRLLIQPRNGVVGPSGGRVGLREQNRPVLPPGLLPHQICQRGISRTFQTLRLFLNMSVKENVMAAAYGHTKAGVFRSMLRYIADTGKPYRVTLVYSNRDRASTPFLDELQELERTLPGFELVLTMTQDDGWEGESRYVSAELLSDHLEGELGDHTYLVAGPPAMVEAVTGQLSAAGVPDEQVLPDRFSGY
jgi:hypothetical protein